MAAIISRIQPLPDNAIATLHRSEFGRVEFLRCNGRHSIAARREIATRLHFTLPLSGCFVWHAEREDVFADPTTLLCTQEGESFLMSHPHGGDQSLVMTPSVKLIDSLAERFGTDLFQCGRRMRIAPPRAQWLASAFYQGRVAGDAADACLLQFFESIASNDTRPRPLKDETLVRRALDYVHHTPERELTLQHVAAALQVGPSYLTHAFSRHMGQPLYRYIVRLKLSRALLRIVAGTEDLTQIALDLGFSSHSHLSAAFKARYGRSPSSTRRDHATQTHEVGASELQWRPLCVARGGIH